MNKNFMIIIIRKNIKLYKNKSVIIKNLIFINKLYNTITKFILYRYIIYNNYL